MSKLLRNKCGSTLIEVVIAIAVFVVVASGIMVVMISSQSITLNNYEKRQKNEVIVGSMDVALSSKAEGSTEITTGSMSVSDMDVDVSFSSGDPLSIPSQSMVNTNQHIGFVKKK